VHLSLPPACSTPEAIAWDPKWATTAGDISGRAVDVHDSSGGFKLEQDAKLKAAGAVRTTASMVQAAAPSRSGIVPRARAQRRLPAFVGMRQVAGVSSRGFAFV
jgi:asparagine synthase (glutamine-hydrolysing)